MKHTSISQSLICFACALLCCPMWTAAQTEDDSLITRHVVVEKEYQPIIQHTGKLNLVPKQVETRIEPAKVVYSDYSAPLNTSGNFNPLSVSAIRFNQPQSTNGYLEGAIGHPLSYLDFGYRLQPKKDIYMDFFAHHNGQWGVRTWEETQIGMRFLKQYSDFNVYFNVDGANNFFTRYGRYYTGDGSLSAKYKDLTKDDKQHAWTVNANVGIASRNSQAVRYRIQTGYTAYILPNKVCDHLVRTYADVAWHGDAHAAGVNLSLQNEIFTVDQSLGLPDSSYNARHALRIEPFYEYAIQKLRVHVGVNLDMNIGKGKFLSNNKNLAFAPSPNVQLEYRILPEWLALYAKAEGSFGTSAFQSCMQANPYEDIRPGITSHHVSAYIPVEASLGIRLRPAKTLYMDIYARYAYLKNSLVWLAPTQEEMLAGPTDLGHLYSDWQRWTVGAQFSYHYQDIITIALGGNYFAWKQQNLEANTEILPLSDEEFTEIKAKKLNYDRPAWDLHLRIDANINTKWSLYSDNHFGGSCKALLTDGTAATLKELIDLRLGVGYNINRWLSCYLQLNNYLNRHNDIFYGYQSQGINGQIGVRWCF